MRHRLYSALSVAAACLLWAAASTPAAAQQGAHDLKCNGALNPRGVRTPHPQLSWTINPVMIQRAYQILVASSEEKLKNDEGDLWDSGKVVSDQTSAQYRGRDLSSQQRCYWKVRIWGAYYSAGAYSDSAIWDMGVLLFDRPEGK